MGDASSAETGAAPGVPRRGRRLAVAAAIAALCVALLVFGAAPSETERRLAGLWRFNTVLLAGAGLWLAAIVASDAVSRSLSLRLVAVTVVGALTLGLVELAGWAGLVDYGRLLTGAGGEILGSKPLPNVDISGTTREDTASTWGLPTEPVAFRYKTDRRGYRNETDRESADVYLLGDSCLVAALLPFGETLCGRLEATLSRPVMNVALIGIGVQEERDRFRDAKLDVKDRLVLQFVFEGNDQGDSATYRERAESAGAAAPAGRGPSFTWSALMKLQRWLQPVDPIAKRRTGEIAGRGYTFFWTAQQFRGREGEIPHILSALGDVRRATEEAGGRYAVVVIPEKIRILGPLCTWPEGSELADWRAHCSPLPDAVRTWGREQGVPVLDLTDALAATAAAGTIPWWPGDTHWNAAGHDVACRAVADWVRTNGWTAPR